MVRGGVNGALVLRCAGKIFVLRYGFRAHLFYFWGGDVGLGELTVKRC